jgi:hypothetical protein
VFSSNIGYPQDVTMLPEGERQDAMGHPGTKEAGMAETSLYRGQRWVERLFEHIRQEYHDRVHVVQWTWHVVGDAYQLGFLVDNYAHRHFIPFAYQGFPRSYIEYAGDPNPINDELRDYIEACIRWQYHALVPPAVPGSDGVPGGAAVGPESP